MRPECDEVKGDEGLVSGVSPYLEWGWGCVWERWADPGGWHSLGEH